MPSIARTSLKSTVVLSFSPKPWTIRAMIASAPANRRSPCSSTVVTPSASVTLRMADSPLGATCIMCRPRSRESLSNTATPRTLLPCSFSLGDSTAIPT